MANEYRTSTYAVQVLYRGISYGRSTTSGAAVLRTTLCQPEEGGHRYWRIKITALQAGGNRAALAQARFYMTNGQLLPGYPGFTGTYTQQQIRDSINNLFFDSDLATDWGAQELESIEPGIFYVDCGAGNALRVQRFCLWASATRTTEAPLDFLLESSDDFSSWSTELSVSSEPVWSANEQRCYINDTNRPGQHEFHVWYGRIS